MKQPHEDITATATDTTLLGLDDAAMAHRAVLVAVAHHLWSACLVGNPAPVVARMNERIRRPQIGDLVVESSARYGRRPDDLTKGFGILLEMREEWWTTDEEWGAEKAQAIEDDYELPDSNRATDFAWYVQYGPEHVCRWTNCDFMVIPTDRRAFDQPIPGIERDGTATVFTRDGIAGALADSGFTLLQPQT